MNSDEVSTSGSVRLPSNRTLSLSIIILGIVIIGRLFITAAETNNWPGFWYSSLHVVIVGFGTYLALKNR